MRYRGLLGQHEQQTPSKNLVFGVWRYLKHTNRDFRYLRSHFPSTKYTLIVFKAVDCLQNLKEKTNCVMINSAYPQILRKLLFSAAYFQEYSI